MKPGLLKISIRYGVVAGVLAIVLLVILYYSGQHPFLIFPFFDFRIILFGIFVFFALKEYRDGYQDGILYFWQGLFGSFVVVMVSSVISSVGLWIFGSTESAFVSDYVVKMTEHLKSFPQEDVDRIGKEVFERNLRDLPATNISQLVQTHFGQGMVIGFFISLILSVILRRTNQKN